MNELSLFTGAGGGLLGTKLLGWKAVGYVEWEPYCQAVLAQRIKDGFLEEAPIFGDIREFVKSGAAREYRGFTDVVTAGFPCQPHSVAGLQRGGADERDMWPATRDVICDVRPRYVLLENVPGILAVYAARVVADLASLGYVGRSGCISAADCGAPHRRERWWVVAHATQQQRDGSGDNAGIGLEPDALPESGNDSRQKTLADAASIRHTGQGPSRDAVNPAQEGNRQGTNPVNGSWWRSDPAESTDAESFVGRVADVLAYRMDEPGAVEK